KESGFGELLPGADAVIIDEAHQLAETAGQFFGTVVTGRTIADLARDALAAFVNDAPDTADLREAADALEHAHKQLRLSICSTTSNRNAWHNWPDISAVEARMDEVATAVKRLAEVLTAIAGRAASLEQCLERTSKLQSDLTVLR